MSWKQEKYRTNSRKTDTTGTLVISLDFEMFWGIADLADPNEWVPIIERVYTVIPKLLELFEEYGIHATWATVGALMCDDRNEFMERVPKPIAPQTKRTLDKLGISEQRKTSADTDDILFAPALVRKISEYAGQEIGTHTFSHYYCDDQSSTPVQFSAEMKAAQKIATDKGYSFYSAVFPRNQVSENFVEILEQTQIRCFRGVERGWISRNRARIGTLGTVLWYLDNYIPLQRTCSYPFPKEGSSGNLMNIRNSRFFKPYRPQYRFAEIIKLSRYKFEIKTAAKRGEIYHMYWHPHNFAENTEINFQQMKELLTYYEKMRLKYGMKSENMSELCCHVNEDKPLVEEC